MEVSPEQIEVIETTDELLTVCGDGLKRELHQLYDKPLSGDVYIRAFAAAALDGLEDQSSDITQLVNESIVLRDFQMRAAGKINQIVPYSQANLLLRCVQKPALELRREIDYPKSFASSKSWKKMFSLIASDMNLREEAIEDYANRNVTSNKEDRYASTVVAAQLFKQRFSSTISIFDIGCSQNRGLKKIALKDDERFAFPPIKIVKKAGENKDLILPDADAAKYVNGIIAARLALSVCIGDDILPIWDAGNKIWAKNCYFYPGEVNEESLRLYDMLEGEGLDEAIMKELRKVEFVEADILRTAVDKEFNMGRAMFDVTNLSTVMVYQSQDEQQLILEKGIAYTKEKTAYKQIDIPGAIVMSASDHEPGIVVISDFAELDPVNPMGLRFHHIGGPYNTFVFDRGHPEHGLQEILRWSNGRCKEAEVGRGKIDVDGRGPRPVREVLADTYHTLTT